MTRTCLFVEFRMLSRECRMACMASPDCAAESGQASVLAKVEHPFLNDKQDFALTKTRCRGQAKNRNHRHALFASAKWVLRPRAVALTG